MSSPYELAEATIVELMVIVNKYKEQPEGSASEGIQEVKKILGRVSKMSKEYRKEYKTELYNAIWNMQLTDERFTHLMGAALQLGCLSLDNKEIFTFVGGEEEKRRFYSFLFRN